MTETRKKPKRRRVEFVTEAEPGSRVSVAGTFNDWDPEAHPLTDRAGDGCFKRRMLLGPGRYEYKFVINGTWCVDPACPDWTSNDYGSLNSVIEVPPAASS